MKYCCRYIKINIRLFLRIIKGFYVSILYYDSGKKEMNSYS